MFGVAALNVTLEAGDITQIQDVPRGFALIAAVTCPVGLGALACLTIVTPSFLWTLGDFVIANIDLGLFSAIL